MSVESRMARGQVNQTTSPRYKATTVPPTNSRRAAIVTVLQVCRHRIVLSKNEGIRDHVRRSCAVEGLDSRSKLPGGVVAQDEHAERRRVLARHGKVQRSIGGIGEERPTVRGC